MKQATQTNEVQRADTETAPQTPADVQAEVETNIRAQTIGPATVADLGLTDEFVSRVATRIVRSSFELRYRSIMADEEATEQADASTTTGTSVAPASNSVGLGSPWIYIGAALVIVFVVIVLASRQRKRSA